MDIQIISFEECHDKDYGETLVQYTQGDVVSFCFCAVDARDAQKDPGLLVADLKGQLKEERERRGEVVRPLWSELSDNMLKVVLDNPFDMQFFENDDPDWTEALADEIWEESCRLGLDGAVRCGENDAYVTVYAGAMGDINWKEHPDYGKPCFEHEVEKEAFDMGSLVQRIETAEASGRRLGEVITNAMKAAVRDGYEQFVYSDGEGGYSFSRSAEGKPVVPLFEPGEKIIGKVVFTKDQKNVEFVPVGKNEVVKQKENHEKER